ncbi:hypothetical protein BDD12DRAFT_849969 [Trichophaea hybrida]|nr:hypothetical protein BDD12DRAFT_849969 [Trichophaea hybrida]
MTTENYHIPVTYVDIVEASPSPRPFFDRVASINEVTRRSTFESQTSRQRNTHTNAPAPSLWTVIKERGQKVGNHEHEPLRRSRKRDKGKRDKGKRASEASFHPNGPRLGTHSGYHEASNHEAHRRLDRDHGRRDVPYASYLSVEPRSSRSTEDRGDHGRRHITSASYRPAEPLSSRYTEDRKTAKREHAHQRRHKRIAAENPNYTRAHPDPRRSQEILVISTSRSSRSRDSRQPKSGADNDTTSKTSHSPTSRRPGTEVSDSTSHRSRSSTKSKRIHRDGVRDHRDSPLSPDGLLRGGGQEERHHRKKHRNRHHRDGQPEDDADRHRPSRASPDRLDEKELERRHRRRHHARDNFDEIDSESRHHQHHRQRDDQTPLLQPRQYRKEKWEPKSGFTFTFGSYVVVICRQEDFIATASV